MALLFYTIVDLATLVHPTEVIITIIWKLLPISAVPPESSITTMSHHHLLALALVRNKRVSIAETISKPVFENNIFFFYLQVAEIMFQDFTLAWQCLLKECHLLYQWVQVHWYACSMHTCMYACICNIYSSYFNSYTFSIKLL